MNYIIGVIIGLLLAILGVKYLFITQQPEFHIHADFAVFVNGERFDFSQLKYMSEEPCTLDEKAKNSGKDIPLTDVLHLHDGDGSVIHAHAPHLTYADFFSTLKMKLTKDAFTDDSGKAEAGPITFILNGEKVDDLSKMEISDLDQVLISVGALSPQELAREKSELTSRACVYSGSCIRPNVKLTPESCSAENERGGLLKIKDWLLSPKF